MAFIDCARRASSCSRAVARPARPSPRAIAAAAVVVVVVGGGVTTTEISPVGGLTTPASGVVVVGACGSVATACGGCVSGASEVVLVAPVMGRSSHAVLVE